MDGLFDLLEAISQVSELTETVRTVRERRRVVRGNLTIVNDLGLTTAGVSARRQKYVAAGRARGLIIHPSTRSQKRNWIMKSGVMTSLWRFLGLAVWTLSPWRRAT